MVADKERLLRELMSRIPDSVYFKDREGRYVRVNKAKSLELGVTPDEAVGKTDFDFYQEEQAKKMAEDDNRVMETKEPIINKKENVTKVDGAGRHVFVTKIPRYDGAGNVMGTLSLSRDITEH